MHLCLFDIDGTLLNTGGAGQAAMERALESEFGISAPTNGIPVAGRTDRAIALDLLAYHGIEDRPEIRKRFTAAYLRELPHTLHQREGLVLPGIVRLLNLLSTRDDVVLGLLTGNFREGARLKLLHYSLQHHFAFGGFGDDHLDRDDVAREALQEARRYCKRSIRTGLSQTCVIGDTPSDVRCGRAIGATVVAVATGVNSFKELDAAQPDHLFDDFADPDPFLALLDPMTDSHDC